MAMGMRSLKYLLLDLRIQTDETGWNCDALTSISPPLICPSCQRLDYALVMTMEDQSVCGTGQSRLAQLPI